MTSEKELIKVRKHFDEIAEEYDYWKKKNSYYYDTLKKIYSGLIPNSNKTAIFEIGCGTGDIIAYLSPKKGLGIDPSSEMVKIASKNHPEIRFKVGFAENYDSNEKFDYIILSDVIEHISDKRAAIRNLSNFSTKNTIVIFNMGNPLWEPVLIVLEWLKMKMPEGPHYRISARKLVKLMKKNSFVLKQSGSRLLIPLKTFDFVNRHYYKLPFIKKLGLITYFEFRKKAKFINNKQIHRAGI